MPPAMNALIVDDEPLARRRLERLIEPRDDVVVTGLCGNGRDAVERLCDERPELVLLDIRMPDLDGFDVLRELPRNYHPLVLFVTAHDDHALDAFAVEAVDYVLKPFDDERFYQALDRALERHRQRGAQESWQRVESLLRKESLQVEAPDPGAIPPGRLIVRQGSQIRFVELQDVEWFEAAGSYVRAHTPTGSSLVQHSLKQLEQQLSGAGFVRIHRRTLVRVRAVVELQPLFHGEYEVKTRLGARLKLSRTYRGSLERLMVGR